MKTRIYNARILTMKEDRNIFTGEVWIEDGRITDVRSCGEKQDTRVPDAGEWDKEIDACGNLIMPGFKDAHTHSPMTFLRSYACLL